MQWRVLATLAVANATNATQTLSVPYLLPLLSDASNFQKECLAAALFVGMLLGGFASPALSRPLGRRGLLASSFGLQAASVLAGAAAPGVAPGFIFARLLSGFGVGCADPTIFSMVSELVTQGQRELYAGIICSNFLLGEVLTAAFAWLSIEQLGCGWREYYAATAVLPLLCCFSALSLPESPQVLVDRGDAGKLASSLQALTEGVLVRHNERAQDSSREVAQRILATAPIGFPSRDGELELGPPAFDWVRAKMSLACFLIAYVWLGVTTTVIAIFTSLGCKDPYFGGMLFSTFGLLGNGPAIWLVNRFGPRPALMSSVATSILGSVALSALGGRAPFVCVVLACGFSTSMNAVYNALMTYNATAPLRDRPTALALFGACQRLGSILAQFVDGELSEISMSAVHAVNAAVLATALLLLLTLRAERVAAPALLDTLL